MNFRKEGGYLMKHCRISEIVGAVSLLAMLGAPALAMADEELKATLRGV